MTEKHNDKMIIGLPIREVIKMNYDDAAKIKYENESYTIKTKKMNNKINRKEAEDLITEKIIDIVNIYKCYNPEDIYLSISISNDRQDGLVISANNRWWDEDIEYKINLFIDEENFEKMNKGLSEKRDLYYYFKK